MHNVQKREACGGSRPSPNNPRCPASYTSPKDPVPSFQSPPPNLEPFSHLCGSTGVLYPHPVHCTLDNDHSPKIYTSSSSCRCHKIHSHALMPKGKKVWMYCKEPSQCPPSQHGQRSVQGVFLKIFK